MYGTDTALCLLALMLLIMGKFSFDHKALSTSGEVLMGPAFSIYLYFQLLSLCLFWPYPIILAISHYYSILYTLLLQTKLSPVFHIFHLSE